VRSVQTVRDAWASKAMEKVADQWLAKGTHETHKKLLAAVTEGVVAAHDAILAEAKADRGKSGMGTTLVGGIVVGNEMVFAHCGDSRAYIVRDGIAMQLTEDHTLLARLLAAGVDVDTEGEGARFKSMLTNALGIGQECKASTFVVPLADGDRFLLCSDGITEYVKEAEIGEVLGKAASPARAAQKLVEMALDRGGGDNATALVVRVLEAGEVSRPSEELRKEEAAIHACPLWAKVNPQQRLRALRIALPRDHAAGEKVAAQTLGDRVAWIIIEGTLVQDGMTLGPGSLVYPEALLADRPLPDKDGLAIAKTEVRALALRSDDFRELCEDDPDLAEQLMAALGDEITNRAKRRLSPTPEVDWRAETPPVGRPALNVDARGKTLAPGEVEIGRASTLAPGKVDIGRASTLAPGKVELPKVEIPTIDSSRTSTRNIRPKTDPGGVPLRAATEPPALPDPPNLRAPTNPPADERRPPTHTDLGAAQLPRPPAALPALPNPFRQHPRGSTPPSEKSLISTPAQTSAALDKAMEKLTVDEMWAELPGDEEEDESKTKPEGPGRRRTPAAGTEIIVEAEPPPLPVDTKKAPELSEPEISITTLADAADASDASAQDDGDEPAEMVMTIEDDSAKITEVVKDTSSQTITMTVDEPPEPEIVIVKPNDA